MKGPGTDLFRAVERELGHLPFVAEDLGAVTNAVRRLRDDLALPGMRVLQFAFGTDVQAKNFLPHNFPRRTVVYTGTHDNDTTMGWFLDDGDPSGPRSPEQAAKERQLAIRYLSGRIETKTPADVHWEFVRLAMASVANTALVPMQDLLGLGSEARMNVPGRAEGNWEWRLSAEALTPELSRRVRDLSEAYGRRRRRPSAPPWHMRRR